jgi:hypothetical protein
MVFVRTCRQYLTQSFANLQLLKSVVAVGALPCEVLAGYDKVGACEGTHWPVYEPSLKSKVNHVWVCYDPLYVMEKPSESVAVFRVLWQAAEEANLNPHVVKVPSFNFRKMK